MIPVYVYIIETINASLTSVVLDSSNSVQIRRQYLVTKTNKTTELHYTIDNYSHYPGLPTIIDALGIYYF